MSGINLDYIAGFFDGEGYVSLGFHKVKGTHFGFHVRMEIGMAQSTNNKTDILFEIQKYLGFGKIYTRKKKRLKMLVFTNKEEIKNFISLIKNRCLVKRQSLLLLEKALKTTEHKWKYSPCKLKELLEIRRELNNHISPSRSRFGGEIRVQEIEKKIEEITKKYYYQEDGSFGFLLKQARLKNNLTQKELAQKLDVTFQMISKWERNISKPHPRYYEKIKEVLGDFY